MIKLINVNKVYNNISKESRIGLENVNLTLRDKGLVSFVGDSGNGKSTLLNVIASYDIVDSGSVIYNGTNISKLNEVELDYYRKNIIGFIYQDFHLIETLTVYENISLIKLVDSNINIDKKINEVMNEINISDLKNSYPSELSGGEKQRVAIARLLVKDVPIILADEPTGNLDESNSKIVNDLLKELSKKRLVIMVTHKSSTANNYSDRIIKLEKGRLIDNNEEITDIARNDGTFLVKKDKISFKNLRSLSKKIVFKKKRNLIFTIIFSFFILFTFGIGLNSALLDTDKILFNEYEKNNETVSLVKNIYGTDTYDIDTDSKYIGTCKELRSNNYLLDKPNYEYHYNDGVDYYYKEFYNFNIKNITVTDTSLVNGYIPRDGEIAITDYLVASMNFHTTANFEKPSDCIGESFYINNHLVKVTKIIYTDYLVNLELVNKDFKYDNLYHTNKDLLYKLEGEYNMLYMSTKTYNTIKIPNEDVELVINDDEINIYTDLSELNANVNLLAGAYPSKDNEIAMPYQYYVDNVVNPEGSDFLKCLNKEVTLDIEGINKTYTVTGITNINRDQRTFVFNSSELNNLLISKYSDVDYFGSESNYLVFIDDSTESHNLLLDLIDHSYRPNSATYDSVEGSIQFVDETAGTFLYLSLALLALFVLFSYFVISSNINDNKKMIGVLNSIGISKKEISRMYIYKYVVLAAIISAFTAVAVILSRYSLNAYLERDSFPSLGIIYTTWYVPFIIFFAGIITFLISTIIPLKKLRRKSIIEIIYNK